MRVEDQSKYRKLGAINRLIRSRVHTGPITGIRCRSIHKPALLYPGAECADESDGSEELDAQRQRPRQSNERIGLEPRLRCELDTTQEPAFRSFNCMGSGEAGAGVEARLRVSVEWRHADNGW